MDYEERLVIKIIGAVVIAVIGAICFLVLGVVSTFDVNQDCTQVYEELDKNSYHYDADGYFLYIDCDKNVGAFYYGTKPIAHFELENIHRFEDDVIQVPTKIDNHKQTWWYE